MLSYKKIWENDNKIAYEYNPENSGKTGLVVFDKTNGNYEIEYISESDEFKDYMYMLLKKIRSFIRANEFLDSGIIAWY